MTFAPGPSSQKAKDAYAPVGAAERITLGANSSAWFRKDPRAMAYTAGKYAFVAEMLKGAEHVLEIGCGDGFGSVILAQHVRRLTAIDFYEPHIVEADAHSARGNIKYIWADWLRWAWAQMSAYDAIACLDVLEHVDPAQENDFVDLVARSLADHGTFLCGMPTLNSQAHASEHGRAGHINCQHPAQITATLRNYFANVFSFGMIDGAVNVGPEAMRQYQLNICTGPIR